MVTPGPHVGSLPLGQFPLVVGVIRSAASLAPIRPAQLDCDAVELRVDLLGLQSPWREAARRCRAEGIPTVFTVRQAREGGAWTGDEESRIALYRSALPEVDAIDMELRSGSLEKLLPAARAAGVVVIGSFHDFTATPAEAALDALVREGRSLGADVVKLAAFAQGQPDLDRLRALPARFPSVSLCLLGMGPLGPESRISLPLAGSCLTYGFADECSAPGQLSVSELRARLAAAHPEYREWRARPRGTHPSSGWLPPPPSSSRS